jgi:formylglycine-generating enzyme required for sulfatase activity
VGKQRVRTRVRVKIDRDGKPVDTFSLPDWWRAWRRSVAIAAGVVAVLIAGLGLGLWLYRPSSADSVDAPPGMVWIPPGEFWMGTNDPAFPDANPQHLVKLDGFWMDATEVTNAEFQRFVEATGYKTTAERLPERTFHPELTPEMLLPSSMVFVPPSASQGQVNVLQCWRRIPGADWRHPEGPASSIEGRENHPVVHISVPDAIAYAKWAGKSLPTEAQWEYAARGGLDRKTFCWGDEMKPGRKWVANVWQGIFPSTNSAEDGFTGTAPVASFPPNGYGLYDMAGNVWEWCADWYRADYYAMSPERNPLGPPLSVEPSNPSEPRRVQRGGSFLSPATEASQFAVAARNRGDPRAPSSHVGFRCVKLPGGNGDGE